MRAQPPKHPSIEPLESRIAPATFIVTSLADTNTSGTLRFELAAADTALAAHAGVVNTIVFHLPAPAAHTENMITLTGGVLTSKGDVNIVGPGAGKLIINANSASGVFSITDGVAATDSPTTISGLSMINGNTANGAGILSTESLTLKSVIISGNTATSGTAGIEIQGSTTAKTNFSISNSLVSGNSGHYGGGLGLYSMNSFKVSSTIITGNKVTGTGGGGGFYAAINTTGTGGSISSSQITGNTAGDAGGILLDNYATSKTAVVSVINSVISGNSITNTNASGGGIYLESGKALISGTSIIANSAITDGGGIYSLHNSSLTISHCTVSGNTTTGANTSSTGGGGIAIKGTGTATPEQVQITSSTITDNRTLSDGGGLLAVDGVVLNIASSTFAGNNATNTLSHGGGIGSGGTGNNQVNLSITTSKFTDNVCNQGGGISTDLGDNITGTGSFSLTSSILTGNFSGNGGGLRLQSSGAATLKNDTITNNVGTNYGGGLSLNNNTTISITGGLVSGNISNRGGGIEFYHAGGTVSGATITGNLTNVNGSGAGVNSTSSAVTLHADHIFANSGGDGNDIDGIGFTIN